ncbi:MAG: hypothetical protein ACXIU7_03105 [Roseinatronobacter sp.]
MKLNTLLAAGVIGLMGSTALARYVHFSEVDVTADLSVIEDAEAAAFWNTLEQDLEAALMTRLADQLTEEDGARLVVNIERFAIEEPLAPFAVENAALAGRIHVIDLNNNANFDSFELSVQLDGLSIIAPDGTALASAEFAPDQVYLTLVNAFADNVAARVN